jgi:hypothetical protein
MKPIGKVIHYYDKIGVAIIKLDKALKVGERLRFLKGDASFDQDASSLQIEHKSVDKAKMGAEVGLKVEEKVNEGTEVFLLEKGD